MFMAFGISATYLVGAFVPWDILSYVCIIAPITCASLMLVMPESPAFLMSKGEATMAFDMTCVTSHDLYWTVFSQEEF